VLSETRVADASPPRREGTGEGARSLEDLLEGTAPAMTPTRGVEGGLNLTPGEDGREVGRVGDAPANSPEAGLRRLDHVCRREQFLLWQSDGLTCCDESGHVGGSDNAIFGDVDAGDVRWLSREQVI
jgi:hypothetical protein